MSRSIHIFIAAILLALTASPILAQGGILRGVVVDSDGKPIEGVQVTITSEELPSFRELAKSDKRGKFLVRFQSSQTQYQFEMLFEAPGFQSFTQPLSPTATRQMREEFVMEKGEARVVKSLGDLGSVVSGSSNAAISAFNAGLTAQKEGDLATAQVKLEEATAADPSLGPAQVSLAQVLLDLRKYEEAVAASDTALGLEINRAEALKVKYQALRALGKREEAEAVSMELDSAEDAAASARRLYNEGGEAFKINDHDTALAKFLKAAELDPSLKDAHHAVATLQLAKGQHAAAAESAEKALALGSDDVNTLRVLYDALDAQGNTDKLMEIAPRLAAVDPEFGGAKLVEQAGAMWNSGETARAVALCRQALVIDPELPRAHYYIGLDSYPRARTMKLKRRCRNSLRWHPRMRRLRRPKRC